MAFGKKLLRVVKSIVFEEVLQTIISERDKIIKAIYHLKEMASEM